MKKYVLLLFCGITSLLLLLTSSYTSATTYSYDQLNRLTGITYADGTTIEYIYDDLGNRIIRNVTGPSGIEAEFSAAPTNGPAPLTVAFTDQSTGAIASRTWDFGDGANSTDANPTHTFSNPGIYRVILSVSNATGASSQYKTITVTPPRPVANFTASPLSGTVPLAVSFVDSSTGNVTSWAWSFGDGGISTSQNPTHTYNEDGSYAVSLIVSGPNGPSDPKAAQINVDPPPAPIPDFSASPEGGPSPLSVQFTDNSTGTITSWTWDFGDGATSTSQSPSHVFTTPGAYTVSLTATGPGGARTNTFVNCITVDTPPPGIDQFTKLMLHGNGADNGNVITDATWNHTPSAVNSVRTSTAQSKFGGSSISLNNSRITYPDSSDWYFADGQDFTVDFWLYTANLPNYGVGIFGGQNAGTGLAVRNSVLGTARQIGLVTNGAASGFISGAMGAAAGPLGGTIAKGFGFASNGLVASVASGALSAGAGAAGQLVANRIDPCSASNPMNAALWGGIGGGLAKGVFPTRNLNTWAQASKFAPTTIGGLFRTPNAWINNAAAATSSGVGGAANFTVLDPFN